MRQFGILIVLAGCGRLGFDEPARLQPDAAAQVGGCPADMRPTKPGSEVCIERDQRGSATWLGSKGDCTSLGRRLCAEVEWADGCTKEPSLAGMTDDWEWVAEEEAGIARKRGGDGTCEGMSTHEVDTDPFGYRCCLTLDPS